MTSGRSGPARARSAARSSRPEMSGPAHSWTLTMPCFAASARNARWARSRCSGVMAARTAVRTAWWASRVTGRAVLPGPDDGAAGDRHRRGVRAGRGVDAPAEQERGVFVRHVLSLLRVSNPSATWGKIYEHAGRFTP